MARRIEFVFSGRISSPESPVTFGKSLSRCARRFRSLKDPERTRLSLSNRMGISVPFPVGRSRVPNASAQHRDTEQVSQIRYLPSGFMVFPAPGAQLGRRGTWTSKEKPAVTGDGYRGRRPLGNGAPIGRLPGHDPLLIIANELIYVRRVGQ